MLCRPLIRARSSPAGVVSLIHTLLGTWFNSGCLTSSLSNEISFKFGHEVNPEIASACWILSISSSLGKSARCGRWLRERVGRISASRLGRCCPTSGKMDDCRGRETMRHCVIKFKGARTKSKSYPGSLKISTRRLGKHVCSRGSNAEKFPRSNSPNVSPSVKQRTLSETR